MAYLMVKKLEYLPDMRLEPFVFPHPRQFVAGIYLHLPEKKSWDERLSTFAAMTWFVSTTLGSGIASSSRYVLVSSTCPK